jgi:ATP synthase protein I
VSTFNKSIKKEAYKLVYWQFAMIVGLALIWFLLQGMQSGLSLLLGGLAYCLPNFLFVWRVFDRVSARAAKQLVVLFFVGEATKLFLSAALVVLIIKFMPVKPLSVLGGYIAAILAFWLISFIFMFREQEEGK